MSLRSKVILIIFGVLIIFGLGFLYWAYKSQLIRPRAETTWECETPTIVKNLYGRTKGEVSGQLVTVNFQGHDVSIHQRIQPYIEAVNREITDAKTGYSFDDVQTYNWRLSRGGGTQSMHSYGIAIDINPGSNPYVPFYRGGDFQTDIPRPVIDIFKKYGFFWGGDWDNPKDPMHFVFYGGTITGVIRDSQTNEELNDVAIYIDGAGPIFFASHYDLLIPSGNHIMTVIKDGYYVQKKSVGISCNARIAQDISLIKTTIIRSGKITGKVKMKSAPNLVLLMDIYLDGGFITTTNSVGEFTIDNVTIGTPHTLEAKSLNITQGRVDNVIVNPGEVKNVDIEIGQ